MDTSENTSIKRCSNPECGKEYPATTEYFRKNGDGLRGKCRECERNYAKAYRQEYPEKVRAVNKAYETANQEKIKAHKKEYGKVYREVNGEIIKERKRIYRQTHKEQIAAKNRAYRLANLERIREHDRDYYRANSEKQRVYHKTYRQLYPDKIRERHRAYAQANAESERIRKSSWNKTHYERVKAHRQANAEIINAHNRNRRAREKSVSGTHTAIQIQEQLKRQHYRCYYAACGFAKLPKIKGKYQYHVEHTFPIKRVAGTDIPGNDMSYLVLSCKSCNEKKHDRFPWEFPEGGRLL